MTTRRPIHGGHQLRRVRPQNPGVFCLNAEVDGLTGTPTASDVPRTCTQILADASCIVIYGGDEVREGSDVRYVPWGDLPEVLYPPEHP